MAASTIAEHVFHFTESETLLLSVNYCAVHLIER